MTDPERPFDTSSPADAPADAYEGPGGWGPAALWLLGGLFALSVVATVHSILVTLAG